MIRGRELLLVLVAIAGVGWLGASAQQPPPRPFPQPNQPKPTTAAPAKPAAPTSQPNANEAPNEALLGVPLYPTAQFLTSYDAGRGQRFYLFGVALPFAEAVNFYRTALKNRGDVLFESPPTHQFEIGRFRDETMAFPPTVTIKDYAWNGGEGYPNPKRGAQPARFPTVIQIVPLPAGATPVLDR